MSIRSCRYHGVARRASLGCPRPAAGPVAPHDPDDGLPDIVLAAEVAEREIHIAEGVGAIGRRSHDEAFVDRRPDLSRRRKTRSGEARRPEDLTHNKRPEGLPRIGDTV
jgi:hypothetical protein